jgi:hypothetical protein
MKPLLSLLLLLAFCLPASIAQLPDCNKLYILSNRSIYGYDPSMPMSSTNPVLNTIIVPGNGEGLAISRPLNTSSTVPTFYTVYNGTYQYHNGTNWVNTGHQSSSVNIAAGGKYIYNLEGSSGRVYRYDGTTEILLTNVPPSSTPYDLIADCDGNWYLLNTSPPNSFLRQYDSSGRLTRSWVLNNPGNFMGNGGFGILGNTIYFDTQFLYSIASGSITADTVFVDTAGTTFPAFTIFGASDFATCAASINLDTRINIVANSNNVCTGTPVTFTSTTVNSTSSATYQWQVNGVNRGGNTDTFTYIPANGDIVTCILTNPGSCLGISTAKSNSITMVTNNIQVPPVVTIANLKEGFCIDSASALRAVTTNAGIPSFQWYKNGALVGNNAVYNDPALATGDFISVTMTITNGACVSSTPVSSDTIRVTLGRPVITGINLNAIPPSTLCSGAPVTFITNDVGGGPLPSYKWYKNSTLITGVSTPTYRATNLSDGDTIMVELISSEACPVRKAMPSNKLHITVHPIVSPSASISANPGTNFTPGQAVTFTANISNGGSTPGFQWFKNGVLIPNESGSTYTTNGLQDGDRINLRLESRAPCPSRVFVTSNILTMHTGTAVPQTSATSNVLSLYPNPNTGKFNIIVQRMQHNPLLLEVINATGQSVFRQKIRVQKDNESIPVELDQQLTGGYYVLRLRTSEGIQSRPFILRR